MAGQVNRGKTKSPAGGRREAGRLDADSWADAALDELAEHGIDRVRVEVLSKRLAVTKGSFYWHFKDRDALLALMLDRWRRRATLSLIERLDRDAATPLERLKKLIRLPLRGAKASVAAEVELAIRLWGRVDDRARVALAEVDELRLRYITQLLIDSGCRPDVAAARAILIYSYQRVASTLVHPADATTAKSCEALLLPGKT